MKTKLMTLASAAMIALTTAAIPNQADAHWRGHRSSGWWGPAQWSVDLLSERRLHHGRTTITAMLTPPVLTPMIMTTAPP